jgi:DHA1 family multidrug resistance protein-like MFS transporter
MEAAIRDAPFGQLVRILTNNKYFQYPEEKPDFKLPDTWLHLLDGSGAAPNAFEDTEKDISQDSNQSQGSSSEPLSRSSTQASLPFTEARLEADEQPGIEKIKSIPVAPKKTKDGTILVDWYYTDDSENPHNWSNGKRALIATLICLYTFVVYTTSAIYTSSTEGIMKEFGVSTLLATLGLSLYVLGYGIGPLIFSPLSEIPVIGRNPVYIVTMFLFVIISIPTAFVNNFAGLVVLRFLQGFFGSPCLASGGASIGDMYSIMSLPYAMMAWVSAAYCGREFLFPSVCIESVLL